MQVASKYFSAAAVAAPATAPSAATTLPPASARRINNSNDNASSNTSALAVHSLHTEEDYESEIDENVSVRRERMGGGQERNKAVAVLALASLTPLLIACVDLFLIHSISRAGSSDHVSLRPVCCTRCKQIDVNNTHIKKQTKRS